MTHRSLAALALSVAIGLVLMMPAPAASQASGGASEVPRTADGRPDLGGVWDFRTVTPLERPAELGDKAYFTEEEAAEFATRRVRDRNVDLNRATTTTARRVVNGTRESVDLAAAYNNFWYDRGNTVVTTGRTSLVIDPPEGRIPTLTAAAQARAAERVTLSQRITEGPEDRSLGERCIVRPNAGPPMTPAGYNNNVQIFQTSDYVAIFTEQIHDARIVPLDERPHLPGQLRQWMGDARGRWEGDTLVVETTNFNDRKYFRGSADAMHLVERFSRADAETLRMQADALGRAVIDGHEDEGRALAHGHCGRHVRAPHHIGSRGGDRAVVRLRAVRVAHAVRGLEVVLPHQPPHPFRRGADPRDPELRPGFPVPFAVKGRGFEQSADVAGQHVVRGGADRPTPPTRRPGRCRLPPRIYEFTVTDPDSFARPWTAQIPMRLSLDPIYEYACHEGNYGMEGTLSGARAIERSASNR